MEQIMIVEMAYNDFYEKYPFLAEVVSFENQVDMETTGVNANLADMIEIAVLKVAKESRNRFRILDRFDRYINPQYPLPKSIVEFNAKNRTYQKYTGRDFHCRLFDTLVLARQYKQYHHVERNKLEILFGLSEKRHSKTNPNFHTAIADCCANLDVLEYLLDI